MAVFDHLPDGPATSDGGVEEGEVLVDELGTVVGEEGERERRDEVLRREGVEGRGGVEGKRRGDGAEAGFAGAEEGVVLGVVEDQVGHEHDVESSLAGGELVEEQVRAGSPGEALLASSERGSDWVSSDLLASTESALRRGLEGMLRSLLARRFSSNAGSGKSVATGHESTLALYRRREEDRPTADAPSRAATRLGRPPAAPSSTTVLPRTSDSRWTSRKRASEVEAG